MTHTILDSNKRGASTDNWDPGGFGTIVSGGMNWENLSELPTGAADVHGSTPLLDDFADYGGYSMTYALLPNSNARDAGLAVPTARAGSDSRGYPRVRGSAIDVGAYESSDYGDWIIAMAPPGADLDWDGDSDGDCIPNGREWKQDLDPSSRTRQPWGHVEGDPVPILSIPYHAGRLEGTCEVQLSHDGVRWITIYKSVNSVVTEFDGLIDANNGAFPNLILRVQDPASPLAPRSMFRLVLRP